MRRESLLALLLISGVVTAGCGSSSSSNTPASTGTQTTAASPNGSLGFEGIPLENGAPLASPTTTAPGIPVDGVRCAPTEQLVYHIHAHLQAYVDGQPRSLPGGIGLIAPVANQTASGAVYGANRCYYWLHTHTSDGVIHIESPVGRLYNLGQFFDEWGQPLGPGQVASATGKVTAYVNGSLWSKSPRAIPLLPHAVIQLDVGSPRVPFRGTSWAGTNL